MEAFMMVFVSIRQVFQDDLGDAGVVPVSVALEPLCLFSSPGNGGVMLDDLRNLGLDLLAAVKTEPLQTGSKATQLLRLRAPLRLADVGVAQLRRRPLGKVVVRRP